MKTINDAIAAVLATATLRTETCPTTEARGRFTTAPVTSSVALPEFDNSAMDGFAVRAQDLPGTLPVMDSLTAGVAPTATLPPGKAMGIMTGAPVPEGADTVVMIENSKLTGDSVRFEHAPTLGQHIRRRGEDVLPGDVVLQPGAALDGGALGALVAIQAFEVDVGQRPRVALLSTGTELVAPGKTPGPGQKVNSNSVTLAAQVTEAGGIVTSDRIVIDTPGAIRDALAEAADSADVVITSGGVSAGTHDFVQDCAIAAGFAIHFWKIAIKPGKPALFGVHRDGALLFGLPGNPVSSMVVCELLVRPALLAMQGAASVHRPRVPVVLTHAYSKKPGRTHFLRVSLSRDGSTLHADAQRRQGSGMVSAMIAVDALVVVPSDITEVNAGDTLEAMLLRAL